MSRHVTHIIHSPDPSTHDMWKERGYTPMGPNDGPIRQGEPRVASQREIKGSRISAKITELLWGDA